MYTETNQPCPKGHTLRYSKTNKCVECSRERSYRKWGGKKKQAMNNRADAKMFRWKTYEGRPCPTCLRTERYTSNCRCVHCVKRINAEQHRNGDIARRRLEIKARLVAEHGGVCTRCKVSLPLEEMEFHHRDPATKRHNVSHLTSCSYAKAKAEADLCDLVCRQCHEDIHGERRY